ncbi:MAG: cytochrome c biogenesis protein CcdA [Paracoccaceae bacterium]|nr:cytochrome c biogenesis protein CcdA [Paracoccaceae bacterium]
MLDVSILGAFFGGILVFFSPCILPIVPFYLSYMAGVGMASLNEDGKLPDDIRYRAIISSVAFSLGIISVFVLLGAAAFSISKTFQSYIDEFRYLASAIIFLIGLHFLGVVRIGFLNRQFNLQVGNTSKMSVLTSYIVGLAFAAGWTPCVGGVLAAVLFTASFEETALRGVGLLLVFGVGLTLPFMLAAAFIKPFLHATSRFRAHLSKVEKAMGLLLILFAFLLFSNSVNSVAFWMLEMSNGINQVLGRT